MSRQAIQVRHKQCKSALTRQTSGFLDGFTHSLQPYSGCSFGQPTEAGQGCPYCYVRKLPVALFAEAQWGTWVEAKVNVADVLRKELQVYQRKGQLNDLRIFMSSATDPYQGLESKLHLTKQCLEVFCELPPGLLVVQTRSPLVLRDLPLLKQLRDSVWVSMTIETNDDDVRKLLTPTSPSVRSRIHAMAALRDQGIRVQAAVSPMLPNRPDEFADELNLVATRVIVDTLFHGDGANGKRSQALGMESLFYWHGFAAWYHRDAHLPLLQALCDKLGSHRVAFSKEGFNIYE